MAVPTVAVTAVITDQSGAVVPGTRISATLNRSELYAGFVVASQVTAITDATGTAILNLFPNQLGAQGSQYTVKIVTPNGKTLNLLATVPNAPCNLSSIASLPAYPGKPDSQIAIDAAITATGQASTSAAAAAASEGAALAIYGNVTAMQTAVNTTTANANSAATSAAAAAASAGTASTAATSAGTSATSASDSAVSALASASEAGSQSLIASTAATSAENSATTATTQAGAATTAATTATSQAGIATTQAANSANSAATSVTNAIAAAGSATSASNSAITASSAATTAQNAVNGIAASVTTATNAAVSAANSSSAASSGASTATTQAGYAATSATSASGSATTATAQAGIATTQAGNAASSAGQSAADVVLTHADVVLTHADVVLTHADVLSASGSAGTATAQAGIATTQAGDASASAVASEAARAAAVVAQNNAAAVVTGGTASLLAAPAKIPLADSNGNIDVSWLAAIQGVTINNIGVAGTAGFGVGICPAVPAGYVPMSGCTNKLSANYGNYQYSDGSVMVWVPAFFMRLGHANNPTYGTHGLNSASVVPVSTFPDDATANAEGYYRHRAFINAGANQLGFFRDKYDCSQNGTIASSILNAMPLVSGPAAGQVGFSVCTANAQTPANAYYGALQAAKSRGNKFFPESVFIADALCVLSEAHAQAATSTTYCAWYDASGVRNFPKGNDNNALKSEADVLLNGAGAVTFTTAGSSSYPSFALTGSGSVFARTTHNGQACGIADVAGNIFKINPGMTCIATSKNITAATQANPVALQVTAHGLTTGAVMQIDSVGGMTQLNGKIYKCTVVDANNLTLNSVDGTAFGAYTSGGTVTTGTFYTLKSSVDIAAVTSGVSTATDHWGATGVAAQFDAVTMNFATNYPDNAYAQRYGNGANAVFGWAAANGRALAMMGMPAASGMSASGSNAMGQDYYYQYIRDQLCVLSRGYWSSGSAAGSRNRYLNNARTNAHTYVGFACASYL